MDEKLRRSMRARKVKGNLALLNRPEIARVCLLVEGCAQLRTRLNENLDSKTKEMVSAMKENETKQLNKVSATMLNKRDTTGQLSTIMILR